MCRYWTKKEGCHRGLDCQYLHLDKDRPEEVKKNYSNNIRKVKEMDNAKYCDIEVQTEIKVETCEVCSFNMESESELFVKDDKLFCILNRALCTGTEWENIEEQALESGMNKDEFLETMAKVLEGHLRSEEQEKKAEGDK